MLTKFLLGFLLAAFVFSNWHIEAQTPIPLDLVDFSKNTTVININPIHTDPSSNSSPVRETRFARPYYGFIGIWNTLGNIRYIFTGVS